MSNFIQELRDLINKQSLENSSDTPDFILAEYLNGCLELFNQTMVKREKWYGRKLMLDSINKSELFAPLDDEDKKQEIMRNYKRK